MKKIFTKSLLLILLVFGGINTAFSYDNADGYDGHFKLIDTYLSLDRHWISWRFPNYENDGVEEALKYSRWYVGGDAAGYNKWQTNPSHYFFYPLCQGTEIMYMERTYGIHQRQNEAYGVGDVYNTQYRGHVRTSDVKFYPGELMGPAQMSNFFVRWTGWWDYNDNGSKYDKDYWMGQAKGPIGSSTDGANWQGSEKKHKGNGIERFYRITYDIPETNAATFTRKPGGKIEASISGNDHGSWNEYYGFSDGTAVDGYGYYTNAYGTVSLSGGKGTHTLKGTFDETQNYTIYYHQFYKRSQTISGQEDSHDKAKTEERTVYQHFQANRISTVVKGFIYPSSLQVTQNKWNRSVKLTWTIGNNDSNHNKDGGWLVFRQKKGETGCTLVTTDGRLNSANTSYTDEGIEVGAEYTYWVTFAPTSYGTVSAPIDSKLTAETTVTHDNTFTFSNVNAVLGDGIKGGVVVSWTPEREASDVKFDVQRWNEEYSQWETISSNQTATTFVDANVVTWKEYRYRVKTNYWGIEFISTDEAEICYALMTTIKEFTASQGTYSNMVKLNWNVTILSEGDIRYVVSRKLLGDPQAVFSKVYEVVGNESSFYYEDISALPGQFYDYKVTAYSYKKAETETEEDKWVAGNSMETDGFVQTRGIVTGRIKYGTGTAVQGAKVLLSKSDNNDDKNKQFYSLHFSGTRDANNSECLEWKVPDEIIENYFNSTKKNPWTVQFYVRPESGIGNGIGTNVNVFRANALSGVDLKRTNDGYEVCLVYPKLMNFVDYKELKPQWANTGVIIPADKFSHLVYSYDGAATYSLRVITPDTDNIEFVEGERMTTVTKADNVRFDWPHKGDTWYTDGKGGHFRFGNFRIGNYNNTFRGNIDEIRIWSKVLTDAEIIATHDRVLTCTEANLLCYWPMDEGINGLHKMYDYSKTSGVANGNHATIVGDALVSEVVPTDEQLSLYGLTDENGNYVIRGVPFSGDGTTYLVRPVMGIHQFNPTYHTRYVSSNTLTHNDVTFEDISSFSVSGTVYYENTTYPVQGCTFSIDGNPCSKDGKLLETDEFGRFEISVPIGDHHITVEKSGHTFINGGRYPSGIDTKFTFDREVSNLTFYDNTLVNVAGRIVGGDIEGNKSIGFGLSTNNIGVAQVVLTPTNDLYSLNVVKVEDGTSYYYENNTDSLVCESSSHLVNSNSWRGSGDNAGRIYINTDAKTGEFSAMVPPLVYNVSAPVVLKSSKTVGDAQLVDLSNPLMEYSDTLINDDGTELLYSYNAEYSNIYHSEPTFIVRQVGFENGAFGVANYSASNEVGSFDVDIVNEDGTPVYEYDYPIFISGDPYTFKLKGYEQYTNEDDSENIISSTVPLENCVVTISNALANDQKVMIEVEEGNEKGLQVGDVVDLEPNQLQLDENGEATYKWKAGLANITAPYTRTLSITYEIGGKVNAWKYDGQDFMEAIILGSLPTGSNFVTQGPDQLIMVLRDPPGSGSNAEWTSGSVTAEEKAIGSCWSSESTVRATASSGGDVTLIVGSGCAYEQKTSTKNDYTGGVKVVTEGENANTKSYTLTTSQTIATSDDPSLVGSLGDVYIGNSTNLIFGKARVVGFIKDSEGNVELGVEDILATGTSFGTYFAYTSYYIQSYLLPNLEALRNDLLISVSEEEYNSYKNASDGLKFITKLTPEDENYGKSNIDDVWGKKATAGNEIKENGVVVALEGPSYKIVYPQRLQEEKDFKITETVKVDQDSVYFYNLQMSNWIRHLANNEKEKIEVWEKRDKKLFKNYSFDGGASISYSYETDTTEVESHEHNSGAIVTIGWVKGFDYNKLGWETELSTETGGTRHKTTTDTDSKITNFTFNLVESGDDALSVDVYKTGTSYIFRTRAGQTSAPYEGEERTQFYQPGKHVLHEATMQIEVPDIEVEVATVSNIASGTAANYTLLLTNKSEIDCDLYYKLLMMDETNPDGAQLSIDGVALSDNRVIKVPAGEVVRKTLQLKQSNLGILDYENIGIVLASQEQGDPTGTYPQIADTVYVSAHYVPSSSPVKMELNRTLLNSSSGTDLDITFNSFDRNYYNLKAFRIQYMKQGDTDWTLLKEYLRNVEEGQQLSSTQAVLPDAANVTYSLDMSSFADGKYTFRILSASTYGTGESTLVTDAVEVIKDMARPMAFGTPKPATGFLGMGDDIELTFNEDINNGRLTSTGNFLVTAALNGAAVAHDIAMLATGAEGAVAKTEANINLIGKSFAVDMWVRISGEGTIFSHGNGSEKLALGIKEMDGKFYFTVNGELCSYPARPLPADKWIYLAFNLDQEHFDGPCYTALYADDATSEYLASEVSIEKYEGNGVVALGAGFTGAIHEVALWDEAVEVANLQAQMYETKMPTTEHLIGYWKLNEGLGTQAKDLARNRHMNLSSTSWYMNNQNKSLNLVDNLYSEDDAIVIYAADCPARTGDDYMIEMWFRADDEHNGNTAYIFDTDAFGVALENGKMKMYSRGSSIMSDDNKLVMSMGNKSYTDGQWHHLAINVVRNGNTVAYVDGEAVGQVASTSVSALQTAWIHLGTQCYRTGSTELDVMKNKLRGGIDEVRIWHATVNASVIRDRMNVRLNGDEPGLVAYYPFEEEKLDEYSQVVTVATAMDVVTKRHEVAARRSEEHVVTFVDEAPALKPVLNETNVNYNFVASERGIVIELNEDAARLEGVTVNVTVKDVLDLNGNKSLPITWTALVKRNQLIWFEDEVEVAGRIGEEQKFTAIVTNQSAQTEYWALNDLPSWLKANFTSGSLPALGNQEITFTVDASAPTGKSEFTVYMSGNNAILVPLTVNMNLKADAPEWSVEPADYEGVATLMATVKINVGDDENPKIIFSEDEDDLVAAFIDGKCAGVTNVQYDNYSDSYRVFLTIYGNSNDDDKEIKLMVWDASTGIVHPVVFAYDDQNINPELYDKAQTLVYSSDATWGDFDYAYVVYASNYIQQSTPLKKNWNWISVYVDNKENGNAVNDVLKSIAPNGIIIKNKSSFSEYVKDFACWDIQEFNDGNISRITYETMYKLQMGAADTLVFNGQACSSNIEIELAAGWNWIPYLRNFSLSIDDALASVDPARNDQIKGQEGFAMYNGFAWTGTLKSLQPGRGYIYRNTSSENKYVKYPEGRSVAAAALAPARRAAVASHFTAVDPTEFESNMTVLAVVKDGEELVEKAQEIAVFDGDVCLATAMVQEEGLFFLTIPGDGTVINRLVVYAVIDGEIVETSTSLYFGEDTTLGDFDKPFAITLEGTTAIDKMLADGNYCRMQIVDLSGRVFYSGTTSEFNELNLADGQYIFEFFTNDGQAVCYKQIIRRIAK